MKSINSKNRIHVPLVNCHELIFLFRFISNTSCIKATKPTKNKGNEIAIFLVKNRAIHNPASIKYKNNIMIAILEPYLCQKNYLLYFHRFCLHFLLLNQQLRQTAVF